MEGKKLLFVVNQAKYFVSHRLVIAKQAVKAGYEVHVASPSSDFVERIEDENITFHNIVVSRSGKNIFSELRTIYSIWKVVNKVKPNLLHLISIKPVLYGGIIARILRIPSVIAISGLGYLFSESRKSVLKKIVNFFYRISLSQIKSIVIVQNENDKRILQNIKALRGNQGVLIPGSGVNLDQFLHLPLKKGKPLVIMPSRMLWDKGVGIFFEAANTLIKRKVDAKFALVGPHDPDNPAAVPLDKLNEWKKGSFLEWWGDRQDMPEILSKSHIVVLPSYYSEGIPKVLLEAASAGRAIITTDTPGCNDVVEHNYNGMLIPTKDSTALSAAIEKLLSNQDMLIKMGERGRNKAERKYDEKFVIKKHLEIYMSLVS